ncbi:MAG: hypothetical protein E4H03_05900 [Myxococcales bacterium]|nr:MAG: hypothetical protein E4H03_05900 [Myxococcales bacterium]
MIDAVVARVGQRLRHNEATSSIEELDERHHLGSLDVDDRDLADRDGTHGAEVERHCHRTRALIVGIVDEPVTVTVAKVLGEDGDVPERDRVGERGAVATTVADAGATEVLVRAAQIDVAARAASGTARVVDDRRVQRCREICVRVGARDSDRTDSPEAGRTVDDLTSKEILEVDHVAIVDLDPIGAGSLEVHADHQSEHDERVAHGDRAAAVRVTRRWGAGAYHAGAEAHDAEGVARRDCTISVGVAANGRQRVTSNGNAGRCQCPAE